LPEAKLPSYPAYRIAALVKDDSTRTKVTVAACKTAFNELKAFMQDFKRRYFIKPPLADADFVSLGLRPPDSTHTPIEPPKEGPTFSIVQMGPRALGVIFRNGESGRKGSKPYGVEGARIYYYISDVPITDQKQLRFSEWATKCPHVFHFSEAVVNPRCGFTSGVLRFAQNSIPKPARGLGIACRFAPFFVY
jgi:hypothetical protein